MSPTPETEHYVDPFFATVDASLIRNASSFFDNNDASIVRELLQNSRRSGATAVSLTRQGSRWVYTDDGPGCEPHDLLGLGTSNWTAGIQEAETPAGCGFFSLARRNPTVTCPQRGWCAELTEAHFNGQAPVEPRIYTPPAIIFPGPRLDDGMVVEFDVKGTSTSSSALNDLARYMPLDFVINGAVQPSRQDFLAPAGRDPGARKLLRVSEHVSMLVELTTGYSDTQFRVCYHGHVVTSYEPLLRFETLASAYHTVVSVLVSRESALPLELPQRNALVAGEQLDALGVLARHTALELAVGHLRDKSTTSPWLWLDARAQGYTGPVLYPKFIGRRVTREDDNDISDYAISPCGGVRCYGNLGEAITFDEFEAQGFKIAPDRDGLALLAQTPIPCHKEGASWVYELDTEDYFATGLRLLRLLPAMEDSRTPAEGAEGYEWFERLQALKRAGSGWDDCITVRAKGRTKDGREITFEEGFSTECGRLDEGNLYDSIELEYSSDDEGEAPLVFPMPALFDLAGSDYETRVNFVLTRGWYDAMPPGFPDALGEAVAEHRKFAECDSDGKDVSAWYAAQQLREALVKFHASPEAHYQEQILQAAVGALRDAIYKLPGGYSRCVIEIPIGGHKGRDVGRGSGTCVFLPVFATYYHFEGSRGSVACDVQGKRDPNSLGYPEYHKFDVATMQQLGMEPGGWDILEACGWAEDGSYTPPEMGHLVAVLTEFEGGPPYELSDPRVVGGLAHLMKAGSISPILWSWFWWTHNDMALRVRDLVPVDCLPPIAWLPGATPAV